MACLRRCLFGAAAGNTTFELLCFLVLHLVLFFITTTGRTVEKGFLFFSYATTYTCFSTLFNMLDNTVDSMVSKLVIAVILMAIMQYILYRLLLPSFKKVAMYIREGWGKF
ncbi:MAG: hypothetical protein E7293_09945, partial [Lachnospiraceae bacterium]|nr:hypothetical protein [Lachnospiraceae bacterium]